MSHIRRLVISLLKSDTRNDIELDILLRSLEFIL